MYLTADSLRGHLSGLGEGQVVILPTLAPGTVVQQVIKTPLTSVRSTVQVDIEASRNAVLDRVPWPHAFFRNFMLAPKTQPGPFYQGYNFADPALVMMGYFKNPGEITDRDVAQYLFDNQDAVNNHFQISVQEKIEADKRKAEEDAKEAKRKGMIINIAGLVLGVLTGGIAAAVLAVAQAAYAVYDAKKMSTESLADAKKILDYLKVSPIAMDDFRTWIVRLVSSPPEVPPTPVSVNVASKFTFFKNGDYITQNNAADMGLSRALSLTSVGDRVTVKDEQAQSVYRVYLRVARGFMGVPPDKEHLLQSMSQAQAIQMAGGVPIQQASAVASSGLSPMMLLLAGIPALWMATR